MGSAARKYETNPRSRNSQCLEGRFDIWTIFARPWRREGCVAAMRWAILEKSPPGRRDRPICHLPRPALHPAGAPPRRGKERLQKGATECPKPVQCGATTSPASVSANSAVALRSRMTYCPRDELKGMRNSSSITNEQNALQRKLKPPADIERLKKTFDFGEIVRIAVGVANSDRKMKDVMHHACLKDVF